MFKKLIIIAAFIAATVGAKAQIVTAKCGCQVEVQKWIWERTDSTEVLEDPDLNNWVVLDFKNQKARVKGGDTYTMTATSSVYEPLTTVIYSDVVLKIRYDAKANYVSHTIEQK